MFRLAALKIVAGFALSVLVADLPQCTAQNGSVIQVGPLSTAVASIATPVPTIGPPTTAPSAIETDTPPPTSSPIATDPPASSTPSSVPTDQPPSAPPSAVPTTHPTKKPSPTPSPSPTATSTASSHPSASPTATSSASATPTASATPSPTATPSSTPTTTPTPFSWLGNAVWVSSYEGCNNPSDGSPPSPPPCATSGPYARPTNLDGLVAQTYHAPVQAQMYFGGSINVDNSFNWTSPSDPSYDAFHQVDPRNGYPDPRIPFDTMGGCTDASGSAESGGSKITNGVDDQAIEDTARQRAAAYTFYQNLYGATLGPNVGRTAVRWCWEWNNTTGQGITAPDYVAAFRYIVQLSRSVGDTHTLWVYCPSGGATQGDQTTMLLAYPGDDVTDVIAYDVYDRDSTTSGTAGVTEFMSIVYQDYQNIEAAATNCGLTPQGCISASKPIWIGETAASCDRNQDIYIGAITQTSTLVRNLMPRWQLLDWFDASKPAGTWQFLGPVNAPATQCTKGLANMKAFVGSPPTAPPPPNASPSPSPTATAHPTASPTATPTASATATPSMVFLIPQGLTAVEALETSSPQAVFTLFNNKGAYENDLSVGATSVDTLPNASHDIYTGCADDWNQNVATTVTFPTPNATADPSNPNGNYATSFTIANAANLYPPTGLAFLDGSGTQEVVNIASVSGNTVTTDSNGFNNTHPTGTPITVRGTCPRGIGTGAWSFNELLNRLPNVLGSPAPTSTDSSGRLVITLKENGVATLVPVDAILYDDELLNTAFQTPAVEVGQAIKYGQQVCAELHSATYTNAMKCILTPGGSIYQTPATTGTYVCTPSTAGWNGGLPSFDGQQGQCRQFAYLLPLMAQDIVTGGHADIIDSQAQGLQGNCDSDCTEFFNATYVEGKLLGPTNTISLVGVGTGSGGNNECYTYHAINNAMYESAIDPNGGTNHGYWFNIHAIPTPGPGGPGCPSITQNMEQQTESALEYLAFSASPAPSPYPTANPQLTIAASTPSSATKNVNLAAAVGFDGWMKYAYSGYATGAAEDDTFTPVMPVANFTPLPTATAGALSTFTWSGGEVDTIYKSGTDNNVLVWPAVNGHSETLPMAATIVAQQANVFLEQTCAPITVTATLSDSSVSPQSITLAGNSNGLTYDTQVTVNFAASANGKTLSIVAKSGAPLNTGSCTGSGVVGLQALGMASLATPAPSPSPTSTAISYATYPPSPAPAETPTVAAGSYFIGGVVGEKCVPKNPSALAAGTAQWYPNEYLCVKSSPGAGVGMITISQGADNLFETGVTALDGNGDTLEDRIEIAAGKSYAAQTTNNDSGAYGGPINFTINSYSSAALLAAQATPAPKTHLMLLGSFARGGTAPYGIQNSDGSLNSSKTQNILDAGVQIARIPMQSFFDDLTGEVNGGNAGGYNFTHDDPALAWLVSNNIVPFIDLEAGPKQYGTNGTYATQPVYHNPTEFANWCTAVANHLHSTYPALGTTLPIYFGTPFNEYNNGGWDASLTDNPTLYAATSDGPALYMKSCYAALKAVFPNAPVYAGELAMAPTGGNPATDAVSEVTRWYTGTAACRVGTCYDGFSLHISPLGDATQYFTQGTYLNAGWTFKIVNQLQAIATAHGDAAPHALISEVGISSVPNASIQTAGDEFGQAYWLSQYLEAANNNPAIDGIFQSNIDEDADYVGTVFFGGSLIDTTTNPSVPRRKHSFYTYCAFAKYPTACPDVAVSPPPTPSPAPSATATATASPSPTPTGTPTPAPSPYASAIAQDSPWFYSPLNAAAGAITTADLGSGGNTAHYVGAAAPTPFAFTPPPGPYSPAGSTSNAVMLLNPTSNYPTAAAITIEGWVTPSTADFAASYLAGSIVDNRDPATSSTWFNLGVHADTAGTGHAACQFNGSGIEVDSAASSLTAGTLYYIACTYNQTVGAVLYVNGASAATSSATYYTPWGSGSPGIYIGGLGSTATANTILQGSLNGTVSNPALYKTALSSARILAHYNAGAALIQPTPTPSPPPTPSPTPVALHAPLTGPYAGAPLETAVCINGNTQVNAEPTIPPGYGSASGHHMGEFGQPGYTRALLALYWESGSTRVGTVGANFSTGNASPITTLSSNVTIPAQDGTTTATLASASGLSTGNTVELGHSPGNNGNSASSADAPTSLIGTITGISGTTITLGSVRDYPNTLPLDTSGVIASGLGVWKVTSYTTWTGDSESYGRTGGGYDNYLAGGSTDTSGLPDPFAIANDTAVSGSPQGLSITAQPVPTSAAYPNESAVESHYTAMTSQNATPEPWPSPGGSISITVGSQENSVQDDFPITIGSTGSGKVAVGFVSSGAYNCNHQSGVCTSGTGGVITLGGIVYLEGSQASGSSTFPTGTNMEEVNWDGNSSGAIDKQMDFQYGFLAAKTRTPPNQSDNSIAFWTLDSQKPYTPNPPAGGIKRNEMDIQEQFGNTIGDAQNMGQLSWNSDGAGGTKGYWLGDFESGGEGGVYTDAALFGGSNTNYPYNAYHEYGGLWTPQVDGNGNFGVPGVQTNFANGGAPPTGNSCCQIGNGVTTAGDSGYVDGEPVPGHIGTADLTENTSGKEVIAIFQVENGSADDVNVTTTTNSFVVPNAYASTVNVTVASLSGWVQMLGKQYDIHGTGGINMRGMLVGVNTGTSTLTFYSMVDITAGGSSYGSTMPSGATVTAAGERSHAWPQSYWIQYIRQYTPMTSGGACT